MSAAYLRFGDAVLTPDGPAIFQGYWQPERQLAKVKMDGGWFRSFHVSNIKPLAQACHDIPEGVSA